jgi:hypothetical protein
MEEMSVFGVGGNGGEQARYLTPFHRFLEKYQNREKKETYKSKLKFSK